MLLIKMNHYKLNLPQCIGCSMSCSWIAPNLEHCPGYRSPALNPEKVFRKNNVNATILLQVEETTGVHMLLVYRYLTKLTSQ